MTTLVCRMGTAHRLLICTRWEAGRRWYAGTLTENSGRPAHKVFHEGVARVGRTAGIRFAPLTVQGLTDLLVVLDGDAELFG